MKKIFLTGGNGFIGKNILQQLGDRYNFFCPSHEELDLLESFRVREYLAAHNFDFVIHAAGAGVSLGQAESPDLFKKNTGMFSSLAENSELFGRLIFLGSGAEYGKQLPLVQVKESDFGARLPEDEYGKAKYFASEKIAAMKNAINLRCFGVFGKYEDYATRFISNIICQSLAGQPIIMKQNTVFDYLYVNDLVKIVAYFMEHEPKEKFYNVGKGQGIQLLELAGMVKRFTNNPYDIQVKLSGLGKEYTCDNSLLLKEMGNFQFTSFEQAIKEMVEWYKVNWHYIDESKLFVN